MIQRETVSVAIVGVALLTLLAIALSQKNRITDSHELARWHSEAMDSAEPAEEAKAQTTTRSEPPVETPAPPRADLPILMYHHIREFTDPDDLIGVRLSVSPESFAEQLTEIQHLGYETLTFQDLADGHVPPKPIMLTFDDGYRDIYTRAYPELSRRNMKAVVFIVTKYIGKAGFLSREQVTEMASNGVEIGSHTVSHPYLSKLSAEKQRAEIADSKKILDELSPRPILSFSYPYGDHDDESIRALDRAGYRYAVTTVTGEATTERPLLMKRIRVPDRTGVDSLLRRVRQRPRPSTPSNSGKEAMRATAPLYSSSLP